MNDPLPLPEMKSRNPVRHDPAEINVKGIMIFAGIIVLMVGLVLGGLKKVSRHFETAAEKNEDVPPAASVLPGVSASRESFPQPREQVSPRADLAAFRAREEAEMNSYGWIDRKTGVVRIPVARAMELLSQRAASMTAGEGSSILELQQQRPFQAITKTGENAK